LVAIVSIATKYGILQHILCVALGGKSSSDVADIEPEHMSTGLARMSAMLSGKMTPLVKAIQLHEEP
jgi:hypothetical protein